MNDTVRPFLMFQGGVSSAAIDFYRSLFPDAKIDAIERYGTDGPGPEGTIKLARFTIGSQSVLCSDSFLKHAFGFTPSFSFFVDVDSEERVRELAEQLKQGGAELMPVGSYASARCSHGPMIVSACRGRSTIPDQTKELRRRDTRRRPARLRR